VKVTELRNVSPQSFHDLRNKADEAKKDELVICKFKRPAVFIGIHSDEASVVHSDYCKDKEIPVIRINAAYKTSGYHDKNEFRIFAIVKKNSNYPFLKSSWSGKPSQVQATRIFSQTITSALSEVGVKAKVIGDNIIVNDKKVGRLSVRILLNILRFAGHILLDWDIDTAEKAIISPKHGMREHIRGLKELGYDITFDQMRDAFVAAWDKIFGEGEHV
jgi:lipoate-protein ligase A